MTNETGAPPHTDPIDALLADPLIRLVMTADRVDPHSLRDRLRETAGFRHALRQAVIGMVAVDVSLTPDPAGPYRPAVGIALFNDRGEVFVGRRVDRAQDGWQMPQGGIKLGETPLAAARRELREEVGTDNISVIAESRGWLRYDLPPQLVGRAWGGRWRGQQQKWFAMRFCGQDSEIDVASAHPEFSAWRWAPAAWVPELIVGFKRQLYHDVLREFAGIATGVGGPDTAEPAADAPTSPA